MANAVTERNIKAGQTLVKRLKGIDKSIDKIIAEIATTTETSNFYWARINRDLRKQYEAARKISANWTNKSIPASYKFAVKENLTKIKAKVIKPPIKVVAKDFLNKDSTRQSVGSLVKETNSTFQIGYLSGEKTMLRLTSLTQQLNVAEKEIEREIAAGFLEKGTAQGSAKAVQKELMKKAIDGKYINLINKNGKPEQWKIKTYSELVARTKLQESSTLGVVNTTFALGADLVQVSAHNTNTAYDAQFEGKIYSLSGNDKDFPTAFDLPPFHPNCKHNISTVLRSGLASQGTLNSYVKFSNDEQSKHPTSKAFIPTDRRKLIGKSTEKR